MGKTDGSDTRRAITVSFTQAELDAMERFLEKQKTIRSRRHLLSVAVKYYLHQVTQSRGHVNRNGFPVMAAGDPPAHLALLEPIEERVGLIKYQIHRVIILKAATCHLCKAEAG